MLIIKKVVKSLITKLTADYITMSQFEQTLRLLDKSSTDEEKFIALLILPKIVDAKNETQIQAIFEKLDIAFLTRLLRTGIYAI